MTNYVRDSEGKFIPATQRPDGTWRKARRVKDGYVPQEEVPLYESKGKQFAKKPDLPVGMCPLVAQAAKDKRDKQHQKKSNASKTNPAPGVIVLPNNQIVNESTTAAAAAADAVRIVEKSPSKAPSKPKQPNPNDVESLAENVAELDLAANAADREEQIKKLKKLKKKIREIEMIETKLKSGDLKKPEKDQLDKVKRKNEILQEISDLENQK